MIEGITPNPKLPLHEWAETYLRLPSETTDLDGPFSMYYVPHLYGMFEALDDPAVKEVVCMKAAQVAWTTAMIAFILREIDCDPGPIIAMFSAEQAARDFSQEKLQPTIEATPVSSSKIRMNKRDGGSTLLKKFRNGFLKLVGSNTPRSVKSSPAKIAIVEEPDDSTENLKDQGDSILLLWERTKRIRNSKRVLGGTPKVAGLSRVEKHLEASDKCVLPVECHDCGEKHVLSYDNVQCLQSEEGLVHAIYGRELPQTAVYACPLDCGSVWDDYQRQENIRNTVLNALAAGDKYGGWVGTEKFNGIKGFHQLSELYCCLPGTGLADLVHDYLTAEHRAKLGDENAKIVFINSKLGKPYQFDSGSLEADSLRKYVDDTYEELECPQKGLVVTIGIDVQHDRLAVVIKAWGRNDESWTIYWGEIPASVTIIDKNDPAWSALDELVFAPFKHESGVNIYASAISIDSSDGNTNDAVYSWVIKNQKKLAGCQVMAIKGSSEKTDPEIFVRPSNKVINHKNPKKQTKADKYGVKVHMVGTNKAKNWVEGQLKLLVKGIGRFHFYKGIRDDYFDQMTGEVKAPHRNVPNRLIWQQRPGRLIEAWDCEQYALHAARAIRVNLKSPAAWDALEIKMTQADMFSQPVGKAETINQPVKSTTVVVTNTKKPANGDSMAELGRMLGNG